ncbi:MAG: type II toxin-antitoxin system RelE/ParE family toxin [Spirochaetes bacterium]|nr:type II toxin-antitoxin system RelE/ParE family toxin [Spirochaetota bacterium]
MPDDTPPAEILAVRFFRTEKGNEPVREWLKSLPPDYRKIIGEDIKIVQYGWPVGMPLVRKIHAGLWEVRSHLGHAIARVCFTTRGGTMVLLHGFIKKSKKTPREELATAQKRMMLV